MMRWMRQRPAVFGTFVAAVLTASAHGHVADKSFSTWTLDGTHVRVSVRMRLPELANIPADTTPEAYLPANLVLMTDRGPAPATAAVRQSSGPAEWAIYRWSIETADATPLAIESRLFADSEVTHLHFARFPNASGGFHERVLSVRDPRWPLEHGAAASMSLLGYISLGMHHILEGWDHLAFVIALLLLARSLKEVATLVTGFTIAHSITLGLATLGLVRPAMLPVEIMIGFSIVLIAAENCWSCGGYRRVVPAVFVGAILLAAALAVAGLGALTPVVWVGLALFSFCHFRMLKKTDKPARLRAVLAFAFGLVHGFGFAGVLMEVQMAPGRLVQALLGFNIGVELGQLLVVALVYPVLAGLARVRGGAPRAIVAEVGSAAVCALGVFWVVTRTWVG